VAEAEKQVMIKAFCITYNSDLTEGRGPSRTAGYATTPGVAGFIAAKCPRIMGVSRSDQIDEIVIFESIEEFDMETREGIRKRAIAKLTPEEKAVLGV
jgi:hypothetical protein